MKTSVRVLYSEMNPVERLEFLRNGTVADKYILRNPVAYPVAYSIEQTNPLLAHIDKLVNEFNTFPEDKQESLRGCI